MDSTSIRQVLNNYVLSEPEKNRLIQELERLIKKEVAKKMGKNMDHDCWKSGTPISPPLQDSDYDKNDIGLHNNNSIPQNITFSENDRKIQDTGEQNQRNAEAPIYTDTGLPPSKTIEIKDIKTNEEEAK